MGYMLNWTLDLCSSREYMGPAGRLKLPMMAVASQELALRTLSSSIWIILVVRNACLHLRVPFSLLVHLLIWQRLWRLTVLSAATIGPCSTLVFAFTMSLANKSPC
jgi:hypothetical protein